MNCPLCNKNHIHHYLSDLRRDYFKCENCALVFVPPEQRPSCVEEKRRYDEHQNNPDDPGYRKFLSRIFDPIRERISPPARGLDFGSGSGPTLSVMFEESGYDMVIYDKFYADNPSVLTGKYDFITCTEVVEHLFNPLSEIKRLTSMLKPDGLLGIMTKLVIDRQAFSKWHYKNDFTHVCFFSMETFQWLAANLKCELEFIGKDVILLVPVH